MKRRLTCQIVLSSDPTKTQGYFSRLGESICTQCSFDKNVHDDDCRCSCHTKCLSNRRPT